MKEFKYGEITPTIIQAMQTHIGFENAISKNDLFREVNNVKYNKNNFEHYKRWKIMLTMFGRIRKTSLCFIQSTGMGNVSAGYFVPKRFSESSKYTSTISKSIKSSALTIKRGHESVKDKDFRKEWFE